MDEKTGPPFQTIHTSLVRRKNSENVILIKERLLEAIQYLVEPYLSHAKREKDFLDRERSEIENGLNFSDASASDKAANCFLSPD